MSTIKVNPSGTFQLRVQNKLLPQTFYSTFNTREAAVEYGEKLERWLKQGVVPQALLERKADDKESWLVSRCIVEYIGAGGLPDSTERVLNTIRPTMTSETTSAVNYDWCETWVNDMKRELNLTPGTIKHRVGALRRCFDWMVRKHPNIMVFNPLRQLPRAFANYHSEDEKILARKGKTSKEDEERDRRLDPGEEAAIMKIMEKMPHEHAFVNLALESAMRMREMYTLTVDQINIPGRTIFLSKTKNGDKRQIPMSSVAIPLMQNYLVKYAKEIKERKGIIFPFWNGKKTADALAITTSITSKRFAAIFKAAGLTNFHFHDLRHESTCRFFLRTEFSDLTIAKITGHRSMKMLMRYANLRASEIADGMW
jgi:integrase